MSSENESDPDVDPEADLLNGEEADPDDIDAPPYFNVRRVNKQGEPIEFPRLVECADLVCCDLRGRHCWLADSSSDLAVIKRCPSSNVWPYCTLLAWVSCPVEIMAYALLLMINLYL